MINAQVLSRGFGKDHLAPASIPPMDGFHDSGRSLSHDLLALVRKPVNQPPDSASWVFYRSRPEVWSFDFFEVTDQTFLRSVLVAHFLIFEKWAIFDGVCCRNHVEF